MSYTQLRSLHFDHLPAAQRQRLTRRPREAVRVHAALIRQAARLGSARVLQDRNGFVQAVRQDLGIAGWLAPLFQAALVEILKLLLPIVIRWLESQLSSLTAAVTTSSLDRELLRFAQEAGA